MSPGLANTYPVGHKPEEGGRRVLVKGQAVLQQRRGLELVSTGAIFQNAVSGQHSQAVPVADNHRSWRAAGTALRILKQGDPAKTQRKVDHRISVQANSTPAQIR